MGTTTLKIGASRSAKRQIMQPHCTLWVMAETRHEDTLVHLVLGLTRRQSWNLLISAN